MLKLVRNVFGEKRRILDQDGGHISFKYIEMLHSFQESSGVHLANKLRSAHIQFFKKKMNVKLASQMLSASVADALEFAEKNGIPGFEGCGPTVKFIRCFNDAFDVLNSRALAAHGLKKPVSENNITHTNETVQMLVSYIRNLQCPETNRPMVNTVRKTGFIGFICDLENVVPVYNMTKNLGMTFLLTYKLSQDHLEIFFGKLRASGGCNNNPTSRQFQGAYKKNLVHCDLSGLNRGNVQSLEGHFSVLEATICSQKKPTAPHVELVGTLNRSLSKSRLLDTEETAFDQLEIDLSGPLPDSNVFNNNEFLIKNVVTYVAGTISHRLSQKIACCECVGALLIEEPSSVDCEDHYKFTKFVSRGNLTFASKDVIDIYLITEKYINSIENLGTLSRTDCFKIINSIATLHIDTPVFTCLNAHALDFSPLENHPCLLLKIVIAYYLNIRITHAAKILASKLALQKNSSRQMSNKLVLFKGL